VIENEYERFESKSVSRTIALNRTWNQFPKYQSILQQFEWVNPERPGDSANIIYGNVSFAPLGLTPHPLRRFQWFQMFQSFQALRRFKACPETCRTGSKVPG
jgi:hypothetical protein